MFGTSGIRGPIGETITPRLALRLGRALGADAERVVVGRDVRDSGRMLEHALVAGLQSSGCAVVRVGIESTPTIARGVPWLAADYGVVITGSHNPASDNGFKFWNQYGRAFTREQYRRVIRRATAGTTPSAAADDIGSTQRVESLSDRHGRHLCSTFQSIDGLDVVVDLGNGAGQLTGTVLDRLGCTVTTLNSRRDGQFPSRQSEPTPGACQQLSAAVRDQNAALGLAHDADADRLLAVDETGRFVPGDELFALFAAQAAATGSQVAITVDTSSLVEDVVTDAGSDVVRTAVGDIFVADALAAPAVGFGGEPSGMWIWEHEARCPDAHFAACKLVELIESGETLSSQLAGYADQYVTSRGCLDVSAKYDTIDRIRSRVAGQYDRVDTTDGIRVETDSGWFLIRASGTEPVIRVTAESETESRTTQLFEAAKHHVEPAVLSV